jgi:hypothetical protein
MYTQTHSAYKHTKSFLKSGAVDWSRAWERTLSFSLKGGPMPSAARLFIFVYAHVYMRIYMCIYVYM